jgi:uncharacterized protein (TIGR02001 family)
MRIRPAVLALLLSVLLPPAGLAGISADNFNARLTLTTDYVFRGVSQTDEEAAVQGGFEFEHDSGFFAGIWGSNVDFASRQAGQEPRRLELDLYLGLERQLSSDWSGFLSLIRYDYPGAGPELDYAYNEAILGFRYREQLTASVAYTDRYWGRDAQSFSYEVLFRYPAPHHLDLVAGLGYSDLEDFFGESYTYWNLGISRTLDRFTFDLSYFDTNSAARRIWGERAGDRLVFSITASLR